MLVFSEIRSSNVIGAKSNTISFSNDAPLVVDLTLEDNKIDKPNSDVEEDSDYKEIVIPKKEAGKKKAQSERSRKFKAHQIKRKSPIVRPKEIAKKAARSASWCPSVKAAETEAVIHPFSKIIREGTNCILL